MLNRSPVQAVVAALVVAGLAMCVALVLFAIDDPRGELPGVALGSELVLAVERALALFVAWLLVIVVVARAMAGEMPSEISGRGVRYADAVASQGAKSEFRSALESVERQVDALEERLFSLQRDGANRGGR